MKKKPLFSHRYMNRTFAATLFVLFLFIFSGMFVSCAKREIAVTDIHDVQTPDGDMFRWVEKLDYIDSIVADAMNEKLIPGAVVLVGHKGRVVFRRAYGYRQLFPKPERMEIDTLFDLASLTKVVALTPSIMILREQGKLKLDDKVFKYIPEFGVNRKTKVTIRHLLTHSSGMPYSDDLKRYANGREETLEYVYSHELEFAPGEFFSYSGIGFIVLAELVNAVSGMDLPSFSEKYIFRPLKMNHTLFNPKWWQRRAAAPTEFRGGKWLKGRVEDPRAELLGGYSGHAGLFSTADDLSVFAGMMLGGGSFNGARALEEKSVYETTRPLRPAKDIAYRGLGWDILSEYSHPRGDYFCLGSFGHTGFSGTSIWIDPCTDTYIIILTNRVHINKDKGIADMRRKIANVVALTLLLYSN